MKPRQLFLNLALLAMMTGNLWAAPSLNEGFETYQRGELDTDSLDGGPNVSTNNPWAGAYTPDCYIVGAETSDGFLVIPHGGTNMVRGSLRSSDNDQEYYNLSYWLNASNSHASFTGNIFVDWWFFDSVGQGNTNYSPEAYCDYLALAYYGDIPANQSFASDLGTDGISDPPTARLAIGASPRTDDGFDGTNELSGYDATRYQVYDRNQTGYDTSQGWFNIPALRSVAWHHARIEVLPPGTNGTVDVAYYLDNLTAPALRLNTIAPNGFNCLELNANEGPSPISAYWDDLSFGVLPAPTLSASITNSTCVVSWNHGWILQSKTNLSSGSWQDVVDANTNFVSSPYTNTSVGTTGFFRLRN